MVENKSDIQLKLKYTVDKIISKKLKRKRVNFGKGKLAVKKKVNVHITLLSIKIVSKRQK